MAATTTFQIEDEDGNEISKTSLWSDGCSMPSQPWLKWIDYSKGEIDLSRLPKGASKIKVFQS